jgi:hypothetical protein
MVRINEIIDDEDLAWCIDGSTDLNMVRRLIDVCQNEALLDVQQFGEMFARQIEGFIDAAEGTEEWEEAYENNYDWGVGIADTINDYVYEKWMKL